MNEYPHNREIVVGKSKIRIDILILRSFVKWLASEIYIPNDRQ